MGLTIHYSGRITDKSKLPQLIEEVEEIAIVHGWKYSIYEREFPCAPNLGVTPSHPVNDSSHDGKLYGIDFTPEGSEPVSICFLSNGRMSAIMQLSCWGEFKEEKPLILYNANVTEQGEVKIHSEEKTLTVEDYNRYLYMCSSKTQYAGPQAHEMIVGVFRYIAKTFLADFNMVDEAKFWETGDNEVLIKSFEHLSGFLNSFASTLSENGRSENEDLDSYLRRVISDFRKKNLD
jgi:hypothetical protein